MTLGAIGLGLAALVAAAAWLVALVSFVRAWLIAERHPPFQALGPSRYFNWMGALPSMPPEARPHLGRAFRAFVCFFAAVIAVAVAGIVFAAPKPAL